MIISGEGIVIDTKGYTCFYEEDGDLYVDFDDGNTFTIFTNLTKTGAKVMLDDIAIALGEDKPCLCLVR